MSGKILILLPVFACLASHPAYPQLQEDDDILIEEQLYKDESSEIPEELYEEQSKHIAGMINLNSATREELAASGLFTPFQVFNLMEYRKRYGNFLSVYELAGVTGFRITRLREIATYLSVEAEAGRERPVSYNEMLMINAERVFPVQEGYKNSSFDSGPVYAGSPLRTNIRLRTSNRRNLSLGIAYEKEPGEPFFLQSRPAFLSGYAGYRGNRCLRQVILGSYRIHQGLGLINGTGFLNSPEGYQQKTVSIVKLNPYASLNEYFYYNGIAGQIFLNRMELVIWSSYRFMDLALGSMADNPAIQGWTDFQQKTGLHRSKNEINGQSLGFNFHTGFHTSVKTKDYQVAFMIENEMNGLTRKGMDSLNAKINSVNSQVLSIHWKSHHGSVETFGEIASRDLHSVAVLSGTRIYFNDFIQGLLLFHHYSSAYHGIFPSAYGSGSNLSNEMGIAIQLHAEPGKAIITDLTTELFRYPNPRYLTVVPSTGCRYQLKIQYTGSEYFQWKFRFSKKLWQTTPAKEHNGIRSLENNDLTRLDLQFDYEPLNGIRWQSRIIVSSFSGSSKHGKAYAGLHRANSDLSEEIRFTVQFLVFDVPDWENRIYLYEPGLYYELNFPVCYGNGQKLSFVLSIKPIRKITLACKGSVISYLNTENIGSGNSGITGNKRWDLGLQMRIKL